MAKTPQHRYLVLTKQPQNITDAPWIPGNCWVGVTVTTNAEIWRIEKLKENCPDKKFFVSLEPLLTQDDYLCDAVYKADWIIVGAMTGPGSDKYAPCKIAIKSLIQEAERRGIPIFLKDNLNYDIMLQQWPKELMFKGEEQTQ